MRTQLQLKPLVNLIQLLHLVTSNSSDDPTPLVGDWGLDGTIERGWELLIPAGGVTHFVVPILEMLGFKLLDEGFFFLGAKPDESTWGIEGSSETDLVPDEMLKRGSVDAEMMASLMGRKREFWAWRKRQADQAEKEGLLFKL